MNFIFFKSRVRNYLYFLTKTRVFSTSKSQKRILYFGIPIHPNLGDQAQKYCIRCWLKENYSDYEVLEIPTRIVVDKRFRFLRVLKKNVKISDLIVFQSGYCTHDLGASMEDLMHRIVISNFPQNSMLMLPQTVYFQTEERRELSSQVYNKAEHMLFLARDAVSYQLAVELFPKLNVVLYPDIVTTLIGTRSFDEKRDGIFLCVRHDCEKFYSDYEIDLLRERLAKRWKVDEGDTMIKDSGPYQFDKHLEETLDSVIRKYASYNLVITDRYHGTIFSLIAGTPVIVIKTTDHKVTTGVKWFKGIYEYAYYADSLDSAYILAENEMNKTVNYNPSPYFKMKYYDKLKTLFEETVRNASNM